MPAVGIALNAAAAPFIAGLDDGRLLLPRCFDCDSWSPPWVTYCPTDYRHELAWKPASGEGAIAAWVTYHKQYPLVRARQVPYRVALVELDEGIRINGLLVGAFPDADLHRGARVKFEIQRDEHGPIPSFTTMVDGPSS